MRFARAAALLAVTSCSAAPAAPGRAIAMPGPSRARGEPIARANAACESCHPDIAAEWRASLHRRAHVEPAYQGAFAIEPLPFCQGCHAPEAAPHRAVPPALADLGVGCVTCHDTGAGVLAADSAIAHHAPHAVVRDARFGSSDGCAGCHEFRFPGARGAGAETFMQSTLREHATSAQAATRCAECHMPLAGDPRRPHRSHAFGASRDPDAIRRAVRITTARAGARRLRVELAPAWVGHAFPTGDLFHRLEIVAEVVGPDMLVMNTASRYLTRHFELPARLGGHLRLVADDRVGALGSAPIVVQLDLGEAAEHRAIAWRVAYQRVAHPRSIDARDALLDGEIEIAKGIEEATK